MAQTDGTIVVRWVTRWEIDSSEFRLYRALTANGPWVTIVDVQISRTNGESDTDYEYLDSDVESGVTYFYMLEEAEVSDPPNRYLDWIRQATAGQPGATTATYTPTPTASLTTTPGPSPTPSQTLAPTLTRTATAPATSNPIEAPTATRQFTNTPPPEGSQPQPTATVTPTSRATAAAPSATVRMATPTGPVAGIASPTRPADGARINTPSPSPSGTPTQTSSVDPVRTPSATPTPPIFSSRATAQPVLRDAASRPTAVADRAADAPPDQGWALALGGGAVILAVLLASITVFLWRRRRA